MLKIKELNYSIDGKNIINIPILNLKKGKHLIITGNADSGKTTLLSLISGLLKPEKGSIVIDELDLHALSEKEKSEFRSRNIGIIFQRTHLAPSLSVIENITLAQYLAGLPVSRVAALRKLERIGLKHKKDFMPNKLNLLEVQSVALARALINNPKIVLADEPAFGLDEESSKKILELLIEMVKEDGASLVIASKDKKIKKFFDNALSLNKKT